MIPNRKEFFVMIRQSIPAALAMAMLAPFGLTRSVAAADNVIVQTGSGFTGHNVCCDDDCHKACRPVVETKDVAKRCYGSRCEDFCLPKCSSCLGRCFGGSGCSDGCGEGACHDCEHPRTKKYLVLYIRHHEECVPKCVVEYQSCPTSGCPTSGCPAPVMGMPPAGGAPQPTPAMGIPRAGQPMPMAQPGTVKPY
jgi:hypothetical protein